MKGLRVPDRETKKAPRIDHFRREIGRNMEKLDKKETKQTEVAKVRASVNTRKNFRALLLTVLGALMVLVVLLVIVRIASKWRD